MPVKKEVSPVVAVDKSARIKPNLGPVIVMSGFLTKRNRTLNRWRQRWWQLLDNGMLLYYNNDDQAKQLGQIDIAHTCYDVKLGTKNCPISFPRVAPSCCCFAFTVLKRSYYLYAPTVAEAEKWAESITNASRVLNRRVIAGVDRRKAPDPPGPARPPSCPPNMRLRINRNFVRAQTFSVSESLDDSLDMSLQLPVARPRFATQMKVASSVPDFLDRMGYSPSPSGTNKNPNDRLWLDGSPYPVTTSTFGQTFRSPPMSSTDDIMASMESQELSISFGSPPTPAATHMKDLRHFGQGATTLQCQLSSGSNGELSPNGRLRMSPRSKLQNRCSLPIIFEHDYKNKQLDVNAKTSQYHRPASCVPNPLSCSSANTIPRVKPSKLSLTRVPVLPGMVLEDLQKKQLSDNLAPDKPTQPQPLPRNCTKAQSTNSHPDNRAASYRPVPKPRKSKGMLIDLQNQSPLETTHDFRKRISSSDPDEAMSNTVMPVSYTHLTLPTIYSV